MTAKTTPGVRKYCAAQASSSIRLLPDNCTDEDLLSYPGFDKVWAKHLENPDWKPVFDN